MHRTYSDSFKREALRRVQAGEIAGAVARDLGISRRNIYNWLRGVKRQEPIVVTVTPDDAYAAIKKAFGLADMVPGLQGEIAELLHQMRKKDEIIRSYEEAARKRKQETISYRIGLQQAEINQPIKEDK